MAMVTRSYVMTMKSLQKERTVIVRNKTNFDKSFQQEGVTIGLELQPTMVPWLLPFLAALSMVILLVVSFSLHHKRFVQQQRRVSQYYTLRYHRVAGPILNCSFHEDGLDDTTLDKNEEQTNKLTRLTKSLSFKFKLNRYNTWSPNIFRNRLTGHCPSKKRLESENNSEDVVQAFARLQNLARRDKVNHRRNSLLPGHSTLTSSELLTLADLSGLTRSYSCRARAVGVTTMTGTLAVAKYSSEDTPVLSSNVEVHPASCTILTKKNTHSFAKILTNGSAYDTDYRDGFHSNVSRTLPGPRLSRYLEDDSFSLTANVAGGVIQSNSVTCSRGNSYTDSDDVFRISSNVDCHDPYTDVIASTSGHSYPAPQKTTSELPKNTRLDLTPSTHLLNVHSFHQHTSSSLNSGEAEIDPCIPRAKDQWKSIEDKYISHESFTKSVSHMSTGITKELNNSPSKVNVNRDDLNELHKHQPKVGFTHKTTNSLKNKESCLKTYSVNSQTDSFLKDTQDTCLVRDEDINKASPETVCERPPTNVMSTINNSVNQSIRFYDYWDDNITSDYLDDSLTSLHNFLTN